MAVETIAHLCVDKIRGEHPPRSRRRTLSGSRRRRPSVMTVESVTGAVRMRSEGPSMAAMGRELGVGASTVARSVADRERPAARLRRSTVPGSSSPLHMRVSDAFFELPGGDRESASVRNSDRARFCHLAVRGCGWPLGGTSAILHGGVDRLPPSARITNVVDRRDARTCHSVGVDECCRPVTACACGLEGDHGCCYRVCCRF